MPTRCCARPACCHSLRRAIEPQALTRAPTNVSRSLRTRPRPLRDDLATCFSDSDLLCRKVLFCTVAAVAGYIESTSRRAVARVRAWASLAGTFGLQIRACRFEEGSAGNPNSCLMPTRGCARPACCRSLRPAIEAQALTRTSGTAVRSLRTRPRPLRDNLHALHAPHASTQFNSVRSVAHSHASSRSDAGLVRPVRCSGMTNGTKRRSVHRDVVRSDPESAPEAALLPENLSTEQLRLRPRPRPRPRTRTRPRTRSG
jgi:hypothetical protein